MNKNAQITASVNNSIQEPRRKSDILPAISMPTLLQVQTNESSTHPLNLSLKDFIEKINNSRISAAAEQSETLCTSMCKMCCRKDDGCVNLQHNHGTVVTVSDITRLPSWDIRQILSSVCSRCLVYISAITESSSKLRMRCEKAMYSQSIVLAPPTPDTSPNNFLQVSKTLLKETEDQTNVKEQHHNCYAPGYCDDTPNDISISLAISSPRHTSALPPTLEHSRFADVSRSPSPSNAGHNSMLEIHYERAVSPLNTESGGGGKNKKRNYQRIQVIPVQMICANCSRAYWRKDYYRKHMRRCSAKYRKAKSVITQRSRSRSRIEFDATSVVSEGNGLIRCYQRPLLFHCEFCTVTVDSIGQLKKHRLVHLPHYICDICNNEYNAKNEYDFHRAQCLAKQEVLELTATENERRDNFAPSRRKTRSVSRALSTAPKEWSSKNISTKETKSPAKRSRTPNKKIPKVSYNDDVHSSISNYAKRPKSLHKNKLTGKKGFHNEYESYDDDDDDEDVSVVDTLYSKRMSLTNHWVEEHSLSSQSHLSNADNYMNNNDEDLGFRTLKEYDLYLLERLKIEVKLHLINCFMPDCRFTCTTLKEIMVHDYIFHYKKPWFTCHKCGHCFTSKVFLDYHLDLQNKGRYVCYKCGGNFEYQHQLDHHLIKHNRLGSNGGEKYICKFCDLKFLDVDNLLKHCKYEKHDWNQKRQRIQIDHTMTISNKVQQKRRITNKRYQVKVLNMVLKLLPTKRCIPMEKYRFHLPPHLRIPKRIGQVEFPYPSNPNCVGCL